MISKLAEVLGIFFRLGVTSFGGPIAHLGYFHDEFVKRRKWFDEQSYADLVALCQFLPGPASSQVGISIGLSRAGVGGAIAAWLGFTLPSAIILAAFGIGISAFQGHLSTGWLHGLNLAAVPVVAQALWAMGTKLCYEWKRLTIALVGTAAALTFSFGWAQIGIIVFGGIVGWFFLKDSTNLPHTPIDAHFSKKSAFLILAVFAMLLVILPILSQSLNIQAFKMFDSFFRAGSLVFGGGHVVLPLLKTQVVDHGWVSINDFMAGYGAAQAMPGPLFAFSAYLGAASKLSPSGWFGAGLCLIAAFLPSFFLVFGTLPFWESVRKEHKMRAAMQGINAAVVGLLAAAFYNPVCLSSLHTPKDFAFAIVGLALFLFWKWPSWAIVIATAIICGIMT